MTKRKVDRPAPRHQPPPSPSQRQLSEEEIDALWARVRRAAETPKSVGVERFFIGPRAEMMNQRDMDALWQEVFKAAPQAEAVVADLMVRADIEHAIRMWKASLDVAGLRKEWTQAEFLGNSNTRGLLDRIETSLNELLDLADDIVGMDVAFREAEGRDISYLTGSLFSRFQPITELAASEEKGLRLVIADLREELGKQRKQRGGRGVLSRQLRKNAFEALVKKVRDHWRRAGLGIGGHDEADDGFADTLRTIHVQVAGRSIPDEGNVLSDLRKDWGRRKKRR